MSQSRGRRNQPQIVPSASFEDIIEDVLPPVPGISQVIIPRGSPQHSLDRTLRTSAQQMARNYDGYFRHLVQGWNETVKRVIQDTKHFAESLDSEQIQEQLMALQQDLRSTNNRLGVVQHIQTESRQDAAVFSEHVNNCFDSH